MKKDKSKKGEIDMRIRNLANIINSSNNYFTTSSCAGRIMLLVPGEKKNKTRWLFVSHGKARLNDIKKALKKLPVNDVWFRQESFIIHVSCKDIAAADKLLNAANRCGCKRAGIVAINKKIIVEIVSTEHFDTIIAKKGKLIVNEEFLKVLVEEANKRLERNFEKIRKLEKEIITKLR